MITVLGYDGSPLSEQARALVAAADLVVGGQRHLEAAGASAETLVLGPLEPALDRMAEVDTAGGEVVVLASGDPGLFGIVRALGQRNLQLRVLPGVSSIAAAFALAGVAWTGAQVVSAHGRDARRALNVVRRSDQVCVLTSAGTGPREIAQVLLEERGRALFVAERIGESDQRSGWYSPEEAVARDDWHQPNVVITGDARMGVDDDPQPPWRLGGEPVVGWALPDDAFEHRDGMLTKAEVRAVVLARLAPRPGALVWDVGAGSGSVGLECARLGAAVVAVEQDPEALALIEANSNHHHAPVQLVHGKAPEALEGLPHPDAVFVGGGGPETTAAVAAVRPDRVVVTLATLERVGPTVAALEGYLVDIVLVQVSHLQPLGDGHRLVPANPVFIVSGVLG